MSAEWTVPTFSGTAMGGSPSAARVAMFELCRAVNERQTALDITKSQFYKADGTLGSDLTVDDFIDMHSSGPDTYAKRNLKTIRDAIISMVDNGYFSVSSGSPTELTKTALESAIGTDIDANPIRPQEARYWQAMKDALDILIHARRLVAVDMSDATAINRGYPTAPPDGRSLVSTTDAWSNMSVDTETFPGEWWFKPYLYLQAQYFRPSVVRAATAMWKTSNAKITTDFAGTLIALFVTTINTISPNFSGTGAVTSTLLEPFDLSDLVDSISFDLHPASIAGVSLSGTVAFDIQCEVPASIPFSGGVDAEGVAKINVSSSIWCFDLNSVISNLSP